MRQLNKIKLGIMDMEREQLAKRLAEEQKKLASLNTMVNQLTQELMQTQGKIILLQELLKDFESKEEHSSEECSPSATASVQAKKTKKARKGKKG